MAKEFAKSFYKSKQWQQCRSAYIAHRQSIDGGLCESCGERPGYIVHHKTMLTPDNIGDPEITLAFSNLKYDCHECHNKEHGIGSNELGLVPYAFGPDGDVVPAVRPALPPFKTAGAENAGPSSPD